MHSRPLVHGLQQTCVLGARESIEAARPLTNVLGRTERSFGKVLPGSNDIRPHLSYPEDISCQGIDTEASAAQAPRDNAEVRQLSCTPQQGCAREVSVYA